MSIYNIKSMTLNYDGGLSGTLQLRSQRNVELLFNSWQPVYQQFHAWDTSGFPAGTGAQWIWPDVNGNHPVEDAYMWTTFNAPSSGLYRFYCSMDNQGDVNIDSNQLMTIADTGSAFRPPVVQTLNLQSGIHEVAAYTRNVATSVAGMLMAVYRTVGGVDTDLIMVSNTTIWQGFTGATPTGWPNIYG